MRLLHAESIQLRSFEENAIPPYSILSHAWEDEEVSFQDIQGPDAASKAGYTKIRYACQDALQRGLEYVWVDTCCIDKSSSAELSEAINSMFRWYQNAAVCYAYLADVSADWSESAFNASRWWSRGWTLQELLAPANLSFFSGDGQSLGTKHQLGKLISDITGIGEAFITGASGLTKASIAKRMSWASRRKTTRTEDLAYCLLGIFGISMPLIYGEGEKAFVRLQEEIMKNSDDETLFAWGYKDHPAQDMDPPTFHGPFAREPAAFYHSGDLIPDEIDESTTAYAVTNKGLEISLRVIQLSRFMESRPLAVLGCRPENQFMCLLAIPIHFYGSDSSTGFSATSPTRFSDKDSFMRVGLGECLKIRRDEAVHSQIRTLRFLTSADEGLLVPENPSKYCSFLIRKLPEHDPTLCIWNVEPREAWDPEQRIFRIFGEAPGYIVVRLWRAEGEGFAIAITSSHRDRFEFSHTVCKESPDRPLSYRTLSPEGERGWDNDIDSGYKNEGCFDIEVTAGDRDIRMSTGIIIRTLDLELRSFRKSDKKTKKRVHEWKDTE